MVQMIQLVNSGSVMQCPPKYGINNTPIESPGQHIFEIMNDYTDLAASKEVGSYWAKHRIATIFPCPTFRKTDMAYIRAPRHMLGRALNNCRAFVFLGTDPDVRVISAEWNESAIDRFAPWQKRMIGHGAKPALPVGSVRIAVVVGSVLRRKSSARGVSFAASRRKGFRQWGDILAVVG
jgi:hypothetical protein